MSWLKSMMEKEPPEPENPLGIVVIGNIEPDMHDTAKESVRKALKRAGFKTIDVGKNAKPEAFVAKVKESNADVLALSVNTVPAKNNLSTLVDALKAANLKVGLLLNFGGTSLQWKRIIY